MVELMIIADDFTGALDSGVHFAEKGIRTRVIVSMENDRSWEEGLKPERPRCWWWTRRPGTLRRSRQGAR